MCPWHDNEMQQIVEVKEKCVAINKTQFWKINWFDFLNLGKEFAENSLLRKAK